MPTIESIIDSVPFFYGRKDRKEDPTEYLDIINFGIDEKYKGNKVLLVKRIVFRARLRDKA